MKLKLILSALALVVAMSAATAQTPVTKEEKTVQVDKDGKVCNKPCAAKEKGCCKDKKDKKGCCKDKKGGKDCAKKNGKSCCDKGKAKEVK
jgi:hypothetical protein